MPDRSFLDWPFFESRHRTLASDVETWAAKHLGTVHETDVDLACRKLVRQLGSAGWLKYAIGGIAYGGAAGEH